MYRRRVTPSTTGRPEQAKMSRRPQGNVRAPAKPAPRASGAISHRTPVTVTLRWIGRGEPWVEVRHGGERLIRPGTMPLYALVLTLNGWESSR